MITIVARNNLKKGQKAVFMEIARELVNKSRQEPGCLSYDLYEDAKDEESMVFIENWKDDAAIQAHFASEHFKAGVASLAACLKDSDIAFYRKV